MLNCWETLKLLHSYLILNSHLSHLLLHLDIYQVTAWTSPLLDFILILLFAMPISKLQLLIQLKQTHSNLQIQLLLSPLYMWFSSSVVCTIFTLLFCQLFSLKYRGVQFPLWYTHVYRSITTVKTTIILSLSPLLFNSYEQGQFFCFLYFSTCQLCSHTNLSKLCNLLVLLFTNKKGKVEKLEQSHTYNHIYTCKCLAKQSGLSYIHSLPPIKLRL